MINIVIIGAGMYVCGRGTSGYGTVMPAVCEWKKKNDAGGVYVVATNPGSIKLAKKKINALQKDAGANFPVRYFPEGGKKDAQLLCHGRRAKTRDGNREEPNPYFSARYGKTGSASYRGYGIENILQFLDDVAKIEKKDRCIRFGADKADVFSINYTDCGFGGGQ